MKFILNKDRSDEQAVEADRYVFTGDNQFVTFEERQGQQMLQVMTVRVSNVYSIEWKKDA